MKKIGIYLERKPDSGGAYQYCLAMLKALASLTEGEYEVTAFCTYYEWITVAKNFGLNAQIVQKNFIEKILHYIAEKTVPVCFYRKHLQWLHPLSRRMKQKEVDYCIYPCADKISFMINIPSIVTVFDLMHRYLKDFPEIADARTYRSRERSYTNIAKYAQVILVDSEVGKQQMIESYGVEEDIGGKIKILPFIAPDYVYEKNEKSIIHSLAQYDKYIFYPAQFWRHKNHKSLLAALALLKGKGIIVNAVFCGSQKNAYDEICQQIEQFGLKEQIQILGYVSNDEMIALYSNARALVMPTFFGPTNIPQLEAFVLECPVATSRIFGIPEQVGNAALLFQPDNIHEIAQCVEQLWQDDDLCARLIKEGKKKAEEWGEKEFAQRLLCILEPGENNGNL